MSFVAAGTFVIGAETAAAVGALGTGLIGGALIGAGTGALVNGLTGRSVLNGALYGGLIGGAGGALGGAFAGEAVLSGEALAAADAAAVQAGYPTAAYAMQVGGMAPTALGLPATTTAESLMAASAAQAAGAGGVTAGQTLSGANTVKNAASADQAFNPEQPPIAAGNTQVAPPVSNPQTVPVDVSGNGNFTTTDPNSYGPGWSSSGYNGGPQSTISTYANKALKLVGNNLPLTAAGLGAAYLATRPNAFKPNYLPAYTPPTAQSYGLGATLSKNYKPTFVAAEGGIASLSKRFDVGGMAQNPAASPATHPAYGGLAAAGVTGLQSKQSASSQPLTMDYIQSLAGQYGMGVPSNLLPANSTPKYAHGGDIQSNLGGYSDGGRLLKGPGDGMSDNIPASIANKQPARLADGEFVVPADVVSHLGNGSTDAGAKHLYKMMDNVRSARTGRKAQGKQIKANKYLPK